MRAWSSGYEGMHVLLSHALLPMPYSEEVGHGAEWKKQVPTHALLSQPGMDMLGPRTISARKPAGNDLGT